jgi:hypothetical protein
MSRIDEIKEERRKQYTKLGELDDMLRLKFKAGDTEVNLALYEGGGSRFQGKMMGNLQLKMGDDLNAITITADKDSVQMLRRCADWLETMLS